MLNALDCSDGLCNLIEEDDSPNLVFNKGLVGVEETGDLGASPLVHFDHVDDVLSRSPPKVAAEAVASFRENMLSRVYP